MPQPIHEVLQAVAQYMEIAGACALVIGFLVSTMHYLRRIRSQGALPAFARYRQSLSRVVLTGLEILVAATIIKTITVEPSAAALGVLAIMVAIRTLLSWTMVLEIDGRWPWQGEPPPA